MKDIKIKANEIDVKVVEFTPDWVKVKLFISSFNNMNILDNSVGSMNWQRTYKNENICTLSIWDNDKTQWINRDGYGSDYEESFINACSSFCIGRCLEYLGNFTIDYSNKYEYTPVLKVTEYEEENNEIVKLKIEDIDGNTVFNHPEIESSTGLSEEEKAFMNYFEKKEEEQKPIEEKVPKTRINFNGPNGWTVETIEDDEEDNNAVEEQFESFVPMLDKPIDPQIIMNAREEKADKYKGVDLDTVATIYDIDVGENRYGSVYMKIFFEMKESGEVEELFQTVSNKIGLSVLTNHLKNMKVLTDYEIRKMDLSTTKDLYLVREKIFDECCDYEYSVTYTENAKGYKDFKVKKL